MFEHITEQFINERAIFVLLVWLATLLATFIDLWTGVEAAKARKESIHSKGFRQSIAKYLDYWRFQIMAAIIDIIGSVIVWYNLPYATILCGLGIIVIEIISVRENYQDKKSPAASLPDMAAKIVKCNSKEEAAALMEEMFGGKSITN